MANSSLGEIKVFRPTHVIINKRDRSKILVEELVGDEEFFDEKEYDSWEGNPVGVGNYALDIDDKNMVITRTTITVHGIEGVVSWEDAPHLELHRICVKCHRDSIIKNGTNGFSQRYQCKDCGATFTGTKLGRTPSGDRAMTSAERQAKYRKNKKIKRSKKK